MYEGCWLGLNFPFWGLKNLTVFLLHIFFQFESRIKILPFRVVSSSQLEPWGFDFSSFLHSEFKPCVRQRMVSFCSMQISQWNTVYILFFPFWDGYYVKYVRYSFRSTVCFEPFSKTIGYFWKTFSQFHRKYGAEGLTMLFANGLASFNLSSKIASSRIFGNNLSIVQWNVSSELMPLSREAHLAERTSASLELICYPLQLTMGRFRLGVMLCSSGS